MRTIFWVTCSLGKYENSLQSIYLAIFTPSLCIFVKKWDNWHQKQLCTTKTFQKYIFARYMLLFLENIRNTLNGLKTFHFLKISVNCVKTFWTLSRRANSNFLHIFLFYEDVLKDFLIVIKRFETFNEIKISRYNNRVFSQKMLNNAKKKFVKT